MLFGAAIALGGLSFNTELHCCFADGYMQGGSRVIIDNKLKINYGV